MPVRPVARPMATADGTAGDGEPVVELSNVSRTYEVGGTVTALDGVDLALARGSYTAVMGPSGSGKSTLLNLVGALDTPTAGEVVVDGTTVSSASGDERAAVRRTTIGFVFQTFNLLGRLTAVENVALPLVFDGVDRERRRGRARELLDDVGLGDRHDHVPSELSGGQRQRVAIARALVAEPALVLADEPTGNIDTGTGARILDRFDDINEAGNTLLVVTHERHVAERADRIVHVRDGEVVDDEPVAAEPSGGGPD